MPLQDAAVEKGNPSPKVQVQTVRREAFLLFAFSLSVFLLTSAGFDTSEGSNHYMVAHQIVAHGTLGFPQPQEGIFTIAPNGRTYASHEIGNTLFLLPVAAFNVALENVMAPRLEPKKLTYITGFFVALMPTLYCAITVALLYALIRTFFQQSASTTLRAVLAFTFCTFVWTYSRNLFDGVLCMALLTGAVSAMLQFRRTLDLRMFGIATALYGFGVITRLSMVIPLFAFLVYVTIIFGREPLRLVRRFLVAGLILLPFAAWQLYYNHLRTGHWLLSPVQTAQYADNNALNGHLAVGLAGLLFSPGKSIFIYFPLALLSLFCLRRFWASHRPEAIFWIVLSTLWLLLHAKLASWYGAWGWGPRHFVTIAPVLALPACVAWEWMMQGFLRRTAVFCSLTWGFVLALSTIIGNWMFRLGLAHQQNREADLIWSWKGGQAWDMITGAILNLRNVLLHLPGPTFPLLSPANRYASNTVNIWLNAAAYQGIPWPLLSIVAAALLFIAAYSLLRLRRLIARMPAS